MRLWSIHPSYLDTKGLLAVWREGLLAYHVLVGKTKGYKNHPQLNRFKTQADPIASIVCYLHAIVDEAEKRGYRFDRNKLPPLIKVNQIPVTKGQVAYETSHLKKKLEMRDPERYQTIEDLTNCSCHPLFFITEGEIAPWEKIIET